MYGERAGRGRDHGNGGRCARWVTGAVAEYGGGSEPGAHGFAGYQVIDDAVDVGHSVRVEGLFLGGVLAPAGLSIGILRAPIDGVVETLFGWRKQREKRGDPTDAAYSTPGLRATSALAHAR